MKSKDIIVLKKILDYCRQLEEACNMFENDFDKFVNVSVFRMPVVCASYKLENCVRLCQRS